MAGLASRRYASHLPVWLAKNAGDALYATMTYFGAAFLFPRARARWLAAGALAFCLAIETSQLYHAPWIEAVRSNRLGGLVLGYGFHALDLVCYAIGVALALGIDLGVMKARADRASW